MRTLNSFKSGIFRVNDLNFEPFALEVFRFQYANNAVYRSYADHLERSPGQVNAINEIPFMPIQFFKKHKIVAGNFPIRHSFESSGTMGERSVHHIEDLTFYEQVSRRIFEAFYGSVHDAVVLGLLPSYLERGNSSLVYMVDHLIQQSHNSHSGFFLDNMDSLAEKLKNLSDHGKPQVFLFGVTFALLQLCELINLEMENLTIIETGGMKGRGRELTREELHGKLRDSFPISRIHSEYGMTELMSQSYLTEDDLFHTPAWMRVLIRDLYDPFNFVEKGQNGAINVIDLANIHSCAFIEIEDLGVAYDNGFKVAGRMDNSDLRGCNLMLS